MAKVPPKKKSGKTPQPEAAQLRALERLMVVGDKSEAAGRALTLARGFPDCSGTRRLLAASPPLSHPAHRSGARAWR